MCDGGGGELCGEASATIWGCCPLWKGRGVPQRESFLRHLPGTQETQAAGAVLEAGPSHALCTLGPPVPVSWLALQPLGLFLPRHGKGRHRSLSRGRGQPLLWTLSVGHPMSGLLRAIKTIWSNTKTHGQTKAQRGRDSELRLNRSPTPSLVRFHLPESAKQGPSTITGGGGGGE